MSYKFLLFDLDHTLLDFDVAENQALNELLLEQGFEDIQAFKDYYIPMNKAMWRDLEQGLISKEELVNTRFSRAFAYFGLEKDGISLAQYYEIYLSQQGQTYPGALELLEELQTAGYQLYAATNGIAKIQQGRLKVSGLEAYFEQVFISDQLGSQKPEGAFFEKVGQAILDFELDKALMIGDSLTADIAGAYQAGLNSVWYNAQNQINTSAMQPTYEVQDYDGLRILLLGQE